MVASGPFFEDIAVGEEIPPLTKGPVTKRQLVEYAGASLDFHEIHYDADHARQRGFPTVIVHGLLKCAYLTQLVASWVGLQGEIRRIKCDYRASDLAGEAITCRGRILRKYDEGDEKLIDLEIWAEGEKGDVRTPGQATVALPSRAAVR